MNIVGVCLIVTSIIIGLGYLIAINPVLGIIAILLVVGTGLSNL